MRGLVGLHLLATFVAAENGFVQSASLMQMKHVSAQQVSMLSTLERGGTSDSLLSASSYVEALVKKSAGHNFTMSPDERRALDVVTDFINGTFEHMKQEHSNDQVAVNALIKAVEKCKEDLDATLNSKVASAYTIMDGLKDNHWDCRDQQLVLYGIRVDLCGQYHQYRKLDTEAQVPSCIANGHLTKTYVETDDVSDRTHMEACLVATDTWLQPLYEKYILCRDSQANETAKRNACDTDQYVFERGFCSYSLKQDGACETYSSCRRITEGTVSTSLPGFKTDGAARRADWKVATKVLCLLKVFDVENAQKESALSDCDGLAIIDEHLILTYPPVPKLDTCFTEPNLPCDLGWTNSQYMNSNAAWRDNAPAATCKEACPRT